MVMQMRFPDRRDRKKIILHPEAYVDIKTIKRRIIRPHRRPNSKIARIDYLLFSHGRIADCCNRGGRPKRIGMNIMSNPYGIVSIDDCIAIDHVIDDRVFRCRLLL